MDSFGGYYNPAYNPYMAAYQQQNLKTPQVHCMEKCMMEGC